MLNLIIKDILLQKKTMLFALGYSLFILVAFNHETFRVAAYTMGAVAISYMFVLGAVAYDEKSKSDIIINSLPLKRVPLSIPNMPACWFLRLFHY